MSLSHELPKQLHTLAAPIAQKYGCGVELSLTVHTSDPDDVSWTVEFQKNSAHAHGATLEAAVELAADGLTTAAQDIVRMRYQAKKLLRRAHELEANLPT